MTNLTVVKNEYQHGRGTFSKIYFNGVVIAEKHNGQMTTKAVQPNVFADMVRLSLPIDDEPKRFSWKAADRMFKEAQA